MSTYPGDGEPQYAAAHRRLLNQQSAPPPPPRPDPRTARRHYRATQQRAEAAYNELGARFANWARSRSYQPANYGKLGHGWKIGPLHNNSAPWVSDPGPGEAMRMMRGPTNWYVLHNGRVTTDSHDGAQILGSYPDTSRFIQVVRTNWGCDLSSSTSPGPGSLSGAPYDLGYTSPGWDTAGFLGASAPPARQTRHRRPTLWEKFLDLL